MKKVTFFKEICKRLKLFNLQKEENLNEEIFKK